MCQLKYGLPILLLITISVLFGCRTTTPSKNLNIDVTYSSTINALETIDYICGYKVEFQEYRVHWNKKFGWSQKDESICTKYRNKRLAKHQEIDLIQKIDKPTLFTEHFHALEYSDYLFGVFQASNSVQLAVDHLKKSDFDGDLVEAFVHFQKQLMEIERSFEVPVERVRRLNNLYNSNSARLYFERVKAFFNVEDTLTFKVYVVWWPEYQSASANLSHGVLFLRLNSPQDQLDLSWGAIIAHELVHVISALQPQNQKEELTKKFFDRCNVNNQYDYNLLEEPLAVAWGNAGFSKYVLRKELDASESWYAEPFPSILGRLLWLHVDQIYKADDQLSIHGFIKVPAEYCDQLQSLTIHR